MTPDTLPVEIVSADIIRQFFNEYHLAEKAISGSLKTVVTRNHHLDPPPATEPYCTHSQILYYYTLDNDPIAVVHQYLRPNGSLGGSGKPDPKKLILGDRILIIKQAK